MLDSYIINKMLLSSHNKLYKEMISNCNTNKNANKNTNKNTKKNANKNAKKNTKKNNDSSLIPLSFWFEANRSPIPTVCIPIYVKETIRESDSLIDVLNDETNSIYLINEFMNFSCINNAWKRYKHKLFIIKQLHKNKYKQVMDELYYKPNIGIGYYESFESFESFNKNTT